MLLKRQCRLIDPPMDPRSSSLLDVFSLVVVSAAPERTPRRRYWPVGRADLMRMQLKAGKAPYAELVADDDGCELRELLPPRGQKTGHASYLVTRAERGVLHARLLLPRRRSTPEFHMRVRHPDGSLERVEPVDADGLVTEAPLTIHLRPGTTVVEIAGGGRIDLHFAG